MAATTFLMGACTVTTVLVLHQRSKVPNDATLKKACSDEKQQWEKAMEEGYRAKINKQRRQYYDCYYVNKYTMNAK